MAILDPATFREHQATPLVDTALQVYIDAAEAAIIGRYGAIASIAERLRGGGLYLYMTRRIGTITSVTERYGDVLGITDVVMDPTDYTLLPDRQTLRREYTGVHRADRWTDIVEAVYVPFDDTAERLRVEIALVKLDLAHNPGVVEEQIGDYQVQYAPRSGGALNYDEEREGILASLQPLGLGFA